MFGPGIAEPAIFDHAPGVASGAVQALSLEAVVRFPWAGGRHPCLDALLRGPGWLTGVESKRYEPFRGKARPAFSDAFDRPVWTGIEGYDRLRKAVLSGAQTFKHLDATQLIKHALALQAEAGRQGERARLVYLYAEPQAWPDGKSVDAGAIQRHRVEAAAFAEAVSGDAVEFESMSYRALLQRWTSQAGALRDHADAMVSAFDL